MYTHFSALDKAKQQRIINAALREFGRFGYRKTSAEQLAKSAGIAKGMIFRYFGSKLGLYEYLFMYTDEMMNRWWGGLDNQLQAHDYIEQYRLITEIKLRAYIESPYVFEFLTMLYSKPDNQAVSGKTQTIYTAMTSLRGKTLEQIFCSSHTRNFRADLDVNRAKRYIGWMVDGYANQILADISQKSLADIDMDIYWQEFDELLADCKKLFYK